MADSVARKIKMVAGKNVSTVTGGDRSKVFEVPFGGCQCPTSSEIETRLLKALREELRSWNTITCYTVNR
jgi:hypothetical protein